MLPNLPAGNFTAEQAVDIAARVAVSLTPNECPELDIKNDPNWAVLYCAALPAVKLGLKTAVQVTESLTPTVSLVEVEVG